MKFLRRAAPEFAGAPRPDLILVEFKTCGNGCEFLGEIKSDPILRRIPVMVLSDSGSEDDLRCVYNLHANCCIRKPSRLAEFAETIRAVERFWLSVVTLPLR